MVHLWGTKDESGRKVINKSESVQPPDIRWDSLNIAKRHVFFGGSPKLLKGSPFGFPSTSQKREPTKKRKSQHVLFLRDSPEMDFGFPLFSFGLSSLSVG